MSGFRSSWLGWLLFLCCWLAGSGVRAASLPVDFAAVAGHLDLASRIELLEDHEAALAPAQALDRSGWQTATPDRLNFGVSDAAIWLRLRVENRSGRTLTRWLTLGAPRLEDVRYYRFAPGAAEPLETAVSGLAHPIEVRPEPGLVSIFPVRLAPGESAVLLLRVAGRTRLFMLPDLWEPLSFRVHESDLTVHQLVSLSILCGLLLYMLVHALARKTPHMLLLSAWLASVALYELSFGGYLYRFVLSFGGEPAVRSTVILSNLSAALGAVFAFRFLCLHELRVWRWTYLPFITGSFLLAAQAAFGDLLAANAMTLPWLTGFMGVWQLSIVTSWYRGVQNAGLFMLASLGLWLAVLLRLGEQHGWLPMNSLYDEVLPVRPSLVLGLVMVFGVVRAAFIEQSAYRATQAALLKARQDEHVRLEALVRERTRTLQDAVIAADEANRARSDLLARVNHDLRRPATEIMALAAPLEQAAGEVADYGGAIRRSAADLQGLIDDLIEDAGTDSPLGAIRPEPVDVRRLFSGLAIEAEGLALVNGNHFVWRSGQNLPERVLLDPKRLRQVVINLLDNAAKFTRNGRVELQVDAVGSSETTTLICTVSDTGMGMSADQLAEVFEPYCRAEQAKGLPGLGLGLAIALYWIERMGGSIAVDSAPGQGTTMRVTLPLRSAQACAIQAGAPVQSPLPTAGLACPDRHSLEQARECLRLGAVSDLLDWAADLAASRPQYRDFAERVAALAGRGDLGSLALCLQGADDDGGDHDGGVANNEPA